MLANLTPMVYGVWGAGTLIFFLEMMRHRSQVKDAEAKRDEATTLAADAVSARQKTLEAYDKEVEKFKKHMEQPLIALMTDEQIDKLGNMLAGKLLQANAAVNLTRVQ